MSGLRHRQLHSFVLSPPGELWQFFEFFPLQLVFPLVWDFLVGFAEFTAVPPE
jgi:hypothetical protein